MIDIGEIGKVSKKRSSKGITVDLVRNPSISSNVFIFKITILEQINYGSDAAEDLEYLKSHIEPSDMIKIKWKNTFDCRHAKYKTSPISAYFNDFRFLAGPDGFSYVCLKKFIFMQSFSTLYYLIKNTFSQLLMDFKIMYPTTDDKSLIFKWPNIAKKVINLAQTRAEDDVKILLKKFKNIIDGKFEDNNYSSS